MSPFQTVSGSALNSSQVHLITGRGPCLRVNDQLSVRTRGVKWGVSLDMVGEDTKKTGGTFLIEKSRWRLFPPPMTEFPAAAGGRRFATRIVAEDCDCAPPPHQHYHLEARHFRHLLDFTPGVVVEIDPSDAGYVIRNG